MKSQYAYIRITRPTLLSTRRVWIEIGILLNVLKGGELLSTRRVWIEIFKQSFRVLTRHTLLSTRRVWIEITRQAQGQYHGIGYSPHGEYGLKYNNKTSLL